MLDREATTRATELIFKSRQGVPCLIGATGVGKTDLIKYIAKKHNKKLIIINTSVVNVDDLSGYPYREKNIMKWAIPDWFPRESDCLLFLDEFNRADKQVINALMPLLLSGELHHSAKLPEDCWVAVAFNPDTDDYDMVNSFDDLAISSRLFKLEVNNDPTSWNNWAQDNLNPDGEEYKYKLIKNMLEYSESNKVEIQINQIPNNRSFAKAIGIIDYVKKTDSNNYYNFDVVIRALRGILGTKYVNDNINLLRYCITQTTGKTLFNRIKDAIESDMDSDSVTETIKEVLRDTDSKASREEYRELKEKFHLICNGYYQRIVLSNLNYYNQYVAEYFSQSEVEGLWNSSYDLLRGVSSV